MSDIEISKISQQRGEAARKMVDDVSVAEEGTKPIQEKHYNDLANLTFKIQSAESVVMALRRELTEYVEKVGNEYFDGKKVNINMVTRTISVEEEG